MYLNIAVQYVRARQVTYVREAFKAIIHEVIDADDLDLEADPSAVRALITKYVLVLKDAWAVDP
jgi:hypothetical protein